MRKTLLVAAGFVALRENGDNDGRGYYYDGKADNFFINLGVGIHYFMEPASFASGEFFDTISLYVNSVISSCSIFFSSYILLKYSSNAA